MLEVLETLGISLPEKGSVLESERVPTLLLLGYHVCPSPASIAKYVVRSDDSLLAFLGLKLIEMGVARSEDSTLDCMGWEWKLWFWRTWMVMRILGGSGEKMFVEECTAAVRSDSCLVLGGGGSDVARAGYGDTSRG